MSPPPIKLPRGIRIQSSRIDSLPMLRARTVQHGDVISIWIPGDPPTVTHQAKKIARRGRHNTLVDSDALRAAINCYLAQISQWSGEPFSRPVEAMMLFIFRGKKAEPVWRTKSPDVDNCAKVLGDRLAERGFIANDKLVADLRAAKIEGPHAGIAVQLRPAGEIPPEFAQIANEGPKRFLAGGSDLSLEIFPKPQPEGVNHAS